jgi:superoxide dismutase
MKDAAPSPPAIRCAIYTRKSTEEGLEQEFNTLDAQREACEAFVASQRGEGWELLVGDGLIPRDSAVLSHLAVTLL